ncbi:DUF4191 domain-containing protein [Cryobacterium sp. BB736]|uniref:DUF4191 domain-containing protein n=1 Tax=Cryobacterium sp. BB736 TaxID=2746963 RepID=UPI00187516C1|nr:DUF4191 domain-containing protein [Cryobacterium sp. BB736]
MARSEKAPKAPKPPKEPGRLKQMYQVYKMTRREDPGSVWYMLAGFVLPLLLAILLGVLLARDSIFGLIMWVLAGILGGLLGFMIVLGRRAEQAAYKQIEGQPGAVGAVLKSSLPRGWTGSEMPVAISPRTQDAVYRAVGKGGVVLIGEGPASRTQRMLDDERRKVARILPNVPIHVLHVGPDIDSVPLAKMSKKFKRYKKALNRAEIYAVSNRVKSLSSKGTNLPIPKGIDPTKVRAPRPR